MKHTLRKGSTHIFVQYLNGNFTNNLFCRNSELIISKNYNIIKLDLLGNKLKRNRLSVDLYDVQELERDIENISYIQIDDEQFFTRLKQKIDSTKPTQVHLVIDARHEFFCKIKGVNFKGINISEIKKHL